MDKLLRAKIDECIETLVENKVDLEDQTLYLCREAWIALGKPRYYESKYGNIPIWVERKRGSARWLIDRIQLILFRITKIGKKH